MNLYVIDASVAVKWFLPEVHSEKALEILREDAVFMAPEFLKLEFDSVLSKWCRSGRLEKSISMDIRRNFRELPITFIDHEIIENIAFHYASHAPVTLYDALYLMTAELYEARVITADVKLADSISGLPERELVRLI